MNGGIFTSNRYRHSESWEVKTNKQTIACNEKVAGCSRAPTDNDDNDYGCWFVAIRIRESYMFDKQRYNFPAEKFLPYSGIETTRRPNFNGTAILKSVLRLIKCRLSVYICTPSVIIHMVLAAMVIGNMTARTGKS